MDDVTTTNIRTQMRKGMLEYCILLVLDGGRAYPSDILVSLKQANMIVVEGTLYALLNRMHREGKLTYEWVESTQGPPRKYYTVTPKGKEVLAVMSDAWDEISDTVNHYRNNIKKEES